MGIFKKILPDLKGRVVGVLLEYLGQYLDGLDKNQIKYKLWNGDLQIHDVKLNADAFDDIFQTDCKLPWSLVRGSVSSLTLKVPWSSLKKESVMVDIRGVRGVVAPRRCRPYDFAREEERQHKRKLMALRRIDAAREAAGTSTSESEKKSGWFSRLKAIVLENLKLQISDVHLRFEDCITCPRAPFALGVTLKAVGVAASNQSWEELFVMHMHERYSFRVLYVRELAVYMSFDPDLNLYSTTPRNMSRTLPIPPSRKEAYLLKPVSLQAKLRMQRFDVKINVAEPWMVATLDIGELFVRVTRRQYEHLAHLLSPQHPQLYPLQPPPEQRPTLEGPNKAALEEAGFTSDAKRWWRYAAQAVVSSPPPVTTPVVHEEDRQRYRALHQRVDQLTPVESANYHILQRLLPLEDLVVLHAEGSQRIMDILAKRRGSSSSNSPRSSPNMAASSPLSHPEHNEPSALDELLAELEVPVYPPKAVTWTMSVTLATTTTLLVPEGPSPSYRAVLSKLEAKVRMRSDGAEVTAQLQDLSVGVREEGEASEAPLVQSQGHGPLLQLGVVPHPTEAIDMSIRSELAPVTVHLCEEWLAGLARFITPPKSVVRDLGVLRSEAIALAKEELRDVISKGLDLRLVASPGTLLELKGGATARCGAVNLVVASVPDHDSVSFAVSDLTVGLRGDPILLPFTFDVKGHRLRNAPPVVSPTFPSLHIRLSPELVSGLHAALRPLLPPPSPSPAPREVPLPPATVLLAADHIRCDLLSTPPFQVDVHRLSVEVSTEVALNVKASLSTLLVRRPSSQPVISISPPPAVPYGFSLHVEDSPDSRKVHCSLQRGVVSLGGDVVDMAAFVRKARAALGEGPAGAGNGYHPRPSVLCQVEVTACSLEVLLHLTDQPFLVLEATDVEVAENRWRLRAATLRDVMHKKVLLSPTKHGDGKDTADEPFLQGEYGEGRLQLSAYSPSICFSTVQLMMIMDAVEAVVDGIDPPGQEVSLPPTLDIVVHDIHGTLPFDWADEGALGNKYVPTGREVGLCVEKMAITNSVAQRDTGEWWHTVMLDFTGAQSEILETSLRMLVTQHIRGPGMEVVLQAVSDTTVFPFTHETYPHFLAVLGNNLVPRGPGSGICERKEVRVEVPHVRIAPFDLVGEGVVVTVVMPEDRSKEIAVSAKRIEAPELVALRDGVKVDINIKEKTKSINVSVRGADITVSEKVAAFRAFAVNEKVLTSIEGLLEEVITPVTPSPQDELLVSLTVPDLALVGSRWRVSGQGCLVRLGVVDDGFGRQRDEARVSVDGVSAAFGRCAGVCVVKQGGDISVEVGDVEAEWDVRGWKAMAEEIGALHDALNAGRSEGGVGQAGEGSSVTVRMQSAGLGGVAVQGLTARRVAEGDGKSRTTLIATVSILSHPFTTLDVTIAETPTSRVVEIPLAATVSAQQLLYLRRATPFQFPDESCEGDTVNEWQLQGCVAVTLPSNSITFSNVSLSRGTVPVVRVCGDERRVEVYGDLEEVAGMLLTPTDLRSTGHDLALQATLSLSPPTLEGATLTHGASVVASVSSAGLRDRVLHVDGLRVQPNLPTLLPLITAMPEIPLRHPPPSSPSAPAPLRALSLTASSLSLSSGAVLEVRLPLLAVNLENTTVTAEGCEVLCEGKTILAVGESRLCDAGGVEVGDVVGKASIEDLETAAAVVRGSLPKGGVGGGGTPSPLSLPQIRVPELSLEITEVCHVRVHDVVIGKQSLRVDGVDVVSGDLRVLCVRKVHGCIKEGDGVRDVSGKGQVSVVVGEVAARVLSFVAPSLRPLALNHHHTLWYTSKDVELAAPLDLRCDSIVFTRPRDTIAVHVRGNGYPILLSPPCRVRRCKVTPRPFADGDEGGADIPATPPRPIAVGAGVVLVVTGCIIRLPGPDAAITDFIHMGASSSAVLVDPLQNTIEYHTEPPESSSGETSPVGTGSPTSPGVVSKYSLAVQLGVSDDIGTLEMRGVVQAEGTRLVDRMSGHMVASGVELLRGGRVVLEALEGELYATQARHRVGIEVMCSPINIRAAYDDVLYANELVARLRRGGMAGGVPDEGRKRKGKGTLEADVKFPHMSVIVADPIGLPLGELRLHEATMGCVQGESSRSFEGKGTVSLSHYNRVQCRWDPLVNPSEISFTSHLRPPLPDTDGGVTVTITSPHLDLSVSPAVLGTAKAMLGTEPTRGLYTLHTRTPCRVVNLLPIPLTYSTSGDAERGLAEGASVDIPLSGAVWIGVGGGRYRIDTTKLGMVMCNTSQRGAITVDVQLREGVKEITVCTNVRIENGLLTPVTLPDLSTASLAPGGVLGITAHLLNRRLKIVPLQPSSDDQEWEGARPSPPLVEVLHNSDHGMDTLPMVSCSSLDHAFYFLLEVSQGTVTTLRLAPPLAITNLTGARIRLRTFHPGPPLTEVQAVAIETGRTHQFTSIDPTQSIHIATTLEEPGGEVLATSAPICIRSGGCKQEVKQVLAMKLTPITGGTASAFPLWLHCTYTTLRELQLVCPTWFVNHTSFDFRLCDPAAQPHPLYLFVPAKSEAPTLFSPDFSEAKVKVCVEHVRSGAVSSSLVLDVLGASGVLAFGDCIVRYSTEFAGGDLGYRTRVVHILPACVVVNTTPSLLHLQTTEGLEFQAPANDVVHLYQESSGLRFGGSAVDMAMGETVVRGHGVFLQVVVEEKAGMGFVTFRAIAPPVEVMNATARTLRLWPLNDMAGAVSIGPWSMEGVVWKEGGMMFGMEGVQYGPLPVGGTMLGDVHVMVTHTLVTVSTVPLLHQVHTLPSIDLSVKLDVGLVTASLVNIKEVALVSIHSPFVSFTRSRDEEQTLVGCQKIQVDDMAEDMTLFPVVASFPYVTLSYRRDPSQLHFHFIQALFGEGVVTLSDHFIWRIFEFHRGAMACFRGKALPPASASSRTAADYLADAAPLFSSRRVSFDHLELGVLDIVLTVDRARDGEDPYREVFGLGALSSAVPSIKDSKVRISGLLISNGRDTVGMLVNRITANYIHQLKQNSMRNVVGVLGGIQMLGRPVGLFRNVGEGLRDFVVIPSQARSPVEFGEGVLRGTGSLVGKSLGGALGTVAGLTRGAARVVDTAVAEPSLVSYAERSNLVESTVKGLYDGIAGLVKEPFKGVRSMGAVGGLVGAGKGIVGVVAKPVGGVLHGIASTAEKAERFALQRKGSERVRCPRYYGAHGMEWHETYEYQRWYPAVGWSDTMMPVVDPKLPWSKPKESFVLPPRHHWVGGWEMAGDWEYAVDFSSPFKPLPHELDLVRRRKWVRPYQRQCDDVEGDFATAPLRTTMMTSAFLSIAEKVRDRLRPRVHHAPTGVIPEGVLVSLLEDGILPVVENQRWVSGSAWSRDLRPTDPWKWCDRTGKVRLPHVEMLELPPGYTWGGSWFLEGDGWEYANTFYGTFEPSRQNGKVRRRIWCRRVLCSGKAEAPQVEI